MLQSSHYLSEQYVDPGEDWFPGMPTRGDKEYAEVDVLDWINESFSDEAHKATLRDICRGQGVPKQFAPWVLQRANCIGTPPKGFLDRVRTAQARSRPDIAA